MTPVPYFGNNFKNLNEQREELKPLQTFLSCKHLWQERERRREMLSK